MNTGSRAAFRIGVALAAIVGLVALVTPAAAASAEQVTIVSHVTFNRNGPNYGDFTASGAAVNAGLICESGTFVDTGIKFAGYEAPTGHVQLMVLKAFTCDDGSGTFNVKLQINANFGTGIESFAWLASGTSGDIAALHGAGTGSTVPTDTGNINTYVGTIAG